MTFQSNGPKQVKKSLINTLMKELLIVVIEKYTFEYRDKSKIKKTLVILILLGLRCNKIGKKMKIVQEHSPPQTKSCRVRPRWRISSQ